MEFNKENFTILIDKVQFLKDEVKRYKYDFLTGLKLRKDFDSYLSTLFERYTFEHKNFLLVLIDIDNLHMVNREFGFEAGDNLIRDTALKIENLFQDCISSEIFRIGGDEFGILLKEYQIPALEERLLSIPDCTWGYSTCCIHEDEIFSQQQLFKMTDAKIIAKKLLKGDRRNNK